MTGHKDRFVHDNLPPPALHAHTGSPAFSATLNAAQALLHDRAVSEDGARTALLFGERHWTYAELHTLSDRIATVLVQDMGLIAGNRVLLRAPNNPMLAACWFGVLKAGGVCVATMPLLRARELGAILRKARITHALCDQSLTQELETACKDAPGPVRIADFTATGDGAAALDRALATKPAGFPLVETAADDAAVIAFTSGTTGQPKGCVHFHSDLLAICDGFPEYVLGSGRDDVVTGSPPHCLCLRARRVPVFPLPCWRGGCTCRPSHADRHSRHHRAPPLHHSLYRANRLPRLARRPRRPRFVKPEKMCLRRRNPAIAGLRSLARENRH